MERTTFLHHYRIRVRADGTPYELDGDGATSYEAVDERTGEPVSLKLIAADSIDPAARNQFEEQACAAQKLRHVNIAKVLDFGRESNDFVYVSERLPGETLAAWVRSHGPMPIDAALRVAEQIVSVLSSASFHKVPFPSIKPADVIVVPGQTPEGTWPLIKLTNFGLPPLTATTEVATTNSPPTDPAAAAEQSGTQYEFAPGMNDICSEISSLGATIYFVLTGVALSSETRHAPKLSRFPKSLRSFLARLWHPDPNKRPKDLVVLAEMIRQCLLRFERRREFADRYGIPYRRTIPRAVRTRSARLLRGALAAGAVLLIAALLAPMLFPKTISKIVHGNRDTKDIGVLVGVPDSSSRATAQNSPATEEPLNERSQSTPAPVVAEQPNSAEAAKAVNAGVPSRSPNPPPSFANQPSGSAEAESNALPPGSADLHPGNPPGQRPNTSSEAAVADTSATSSVSNSPQGSSGDETKSLPQTSGGAQASSSSESTLRSKKKTVSSRRARANPDLTEDWPQRRARSVRARVVGITSDGRLILRLPSGRTGIVAPDSSEEEFAPRRHRRVFREPDEAFGAPPQFGPEFPDD